jgi:hypothetical protein
MKDVGRGIVWTSRRVTLPLIIVPPPSSSLAMDAQIVYIQEKIRAAQDNAKKVCVLIALLLALIRNLSI